MLKVEIYAKSLYHCVDYFPTEPFITFNDFIYDDIFWLHDARVDFRFLLVHQTQPRVRARTRNALKFKFEHANREPYSNRVLNASNVYFLSFFFFAPSVFVLRAREIVSQTISTEVVWGHFLDRASSRLGTDLKEENAVRPYVFGQGSPRASANRAVCAVELHAVRAIMVTSSIRLPFKAPWRVIITHAPRVRRANCRNRFEFPRREAVIVLHERFAGIAQNR